MQGLAGLRFTDASLRRFKKCPSGKIFHVKPKLVEGIFFNFIFHLAWILLGFPWDELEIVAVKKAPVEYPTSPATKV